MYDHFDPNTSIGFFNHVSIYPIATSNSGKNLRKYHPNAPVFLSMDGNVDIDVYTPIADSLNAEYLINRKVLGYPMQPYGYQREKVLEWLNRLYIGFTKLPTSHVMLWEDDLLFLGPVDFDEEWDFAGHNITHGNEIHPAILTLIEDFSSKKPKTNFYGSGGGTIFKREPLLEHYHEIYKWLDGNLDWIQNSYYPTIGWPDCLMTIIYFLCGCDYSVNMQLYNLDPHNPTDIRWSDELEQDVANHFANSNYNIIHNYKFWY